MSIEPIAFEAFLHHLNRPGATPAPKPDPGLHRYAPNADRQTLTALTADTDALIAASRQTRADLARARGTDINEQGRAA